MQNWEAEDVCNPPIQVGNGWIVQTQVTLKDPSTSPPLLCRVASDKFSEDDRDEYREATPAFLEARLCYSELSVDNRGWRSAYTDYPSVRS